MAAASSLGAQPAAQTTVAPVTKVVQVLEKMKEQVQAEAEEDEELYGKMECWCKTNDAEKVEAVKQAQLRIEQLGAAIERGSATSLSLKAEMKALQTEIQENQEALAAAEEMHAKEKAEFEAFETDTMESITILKQAIDVLAKVNPAQTRGAQAQTAEQSLIEVRRLVSQVLQRSGGHGSAAPRRRAQFGAVMQKDLWDLMSSLPHSDAASSRPITELSQQPMGAAAGATSYSARSSSIFGILQQMNENMQKELAESQRNHVQAEISFQRLRATKEGEIQTAQASLEDKTNTLADVEQKLVEDKENLATTTAALDADQKFLVELRQRCTTAADDYAKRRSTRMEEVAAIGEAIAILRTDDARDVFSKSMSFVQLTARRGGVSTASQVSRRRALASSRLLALAARRRRAGGGSEALALAKLAVGVQSDGLAKVKELLAKMVTDLKAQQQEEHEHHERCQGDIRGNEAEARARQSDANEANRQITSLEGALAALEEDLKELHHEVYTTQVAIQQAGEERMAQSKEFQQVVADQREAQALIQQALVRLQKFYDEKSFLTVGRRGRRQGEPGQASSPEPSAGLSYEKNRAAPGALNMLEKILQDCSKTEKEAVAGEQAAQDAYADFVANTNAVLDAAAAAIREKTELKARTDGDLAEAKQNLVAASAAMEELHEAAKALHLQCDFLLRNYGVRQTARQEEIEAIQQAISILNGADFGSEAI